MLRKLKGVVVLQNTDYLLQVIKYLQKLSLSEIFEVKGGKYYLKGQSFAFPSYKGEDKAVIDNMKIYFFIYKLAEFLAPFIEIKNGTMTLPITNLLEEFEKQFQKTWPSRTQLLEHILNQGSWKLSLIMTIFYHKKIPYCDSSLQQSLTSSIISNDDPEITSLIEKVWPKQKSPVS
ncbi:hypothetical protein ACFL2U_01350 [Patescibacteria group bacterium]